MGLRKTIIVKELSNEGRKEKGIFIPLKYTENFNRYEVIRGGIGELPEELKKGDIVLTRKTNGSNIELDGQEVKIIHRSEIVAIDG